MSARAVEDMCARAERFYLAYEDVLGFEEQVIDGRLDHAVAELAEAAATRGATRGDFARVVALVEQRAAVAADDLEMPHVRERLLAAIADVESDARTFALTFEHFTRFWNTLIDSRLERALMALRIKAATRGATRADYLRVKDQLEDGADLARGTPPEPCS